ncbi:methyltransferase domain-containing protein [Olivibacter sp. SDN3]|uniref:class I SAM-dependent methyltransferase n=1 Tax=Olivibacter sp. SDN3 TaxID=2764720 RepID=UPI001651037B|nr:methyltransferase domain-containing protein [Olivibacter sp. SDN3]QNL48982.1 methyltransferase domain-containing protein [Olivibacter sp. SDN3]
MDNDIFGNALLDYYHKKRSTAPLILHNNYGEDEEMPVEIFFREIDDFPELEFIALALTDGKVLDVGAGAGSHCLYLQQKGVDVTALEISPIACQIMAKRGIKKIINQDIFSYKEEKFDTLLFLMNGIGLAENIAGLKKLLNHCKKLLNTGGQLIFDSSDVSYLYESDLERPMVYHGEIHFQYEYKNQLGDPFGWLYIDQETLILIAQRSGWVVQILYEDENDQYLVRLSLSTP